MIMVLFQTIFTFRVYTGSRMAPCIYRRFWAEFKTTRIFTVCIKDTLTIRIRGARRFCAQGTCITSIAWWTPCISYLFVSWKSSTFIILILISFWNVKTLAIAAKSNITTKSYRGIRQVCKLLILLWNIRHSLHKYKNQLCMCPLYQSISQWIHNDSSLRYMYLNRLYNRRWYCIL